MIPKRRERHKKVVKHKPLPERVQNQKKITKMVFCVASKVLLWSWRWGHCPSTPLGAMPPKPPVVSVISRGKCDQLMRLGAAVGMECLYARGG